MARVGDLMPCRRLGSPARHFAAVGAVVAVAVAVVAGVAGAERSEDSVGQVRVASEVPVTAMHRAVGPANNSPQIAVDPTDKKMAALANRVDAPRFGCALHVSGDGGRTWLPVKPMPELPDGAETCYGPKVAFGPEGTLYFLFVGLSGEGNTPMGVFLTRSKDGGQSFTEPRQLLGELNFGTRMGVDNDGRLHLVWIDADEVGVGSFAPSPNPIMAAYSDDGGQTLSEPVQVNDADRQRVVAPALEVGPQGEVHVAYYDLRDDARDYQGLQGPVWPEPWELLLSSSADRGESFAAGEVIAEVAPHERIMLIFTAAPPALAAGDGGELCVGWTDEGRGHGDVLARCRPGEDADWRERVRINDTLGDDESTQELPQLAIAPDGRVDAVFYDSRRPPDDEFVDVFYAASTDGGQTFSENRRVSRHTSYSGFGPRYGAIDSAAGMVEFGSRLALAAGDDRALTAWADTRNANGHSQGQAIFAATLNDLPAGSDETPMGWVTAALGGVAVVVMLGVGGLSRRRPYTGDAGPNAAEPQ